VRRDDVVGVAVARASPGRVAEEPARRGRQFCDAVVEPVVADAVQFRVGILRVIAVR